MDTRLKEERETIEEILSLTERKPFPTNETVHLARFLDSCFAVIKDQEKERQREKEEEERRKKEKELETKKRQEEKKRMQELESLAPVPETNKSLPPLLEDVPSPEHGLSKREYVIHLYKNPVGVLVEKDEGGKYIYKVIEPYVERKILEKAKEMYEKEFERDNSLFDNEKFIKRMAQKAANKAGYQFSDLLPQKIAYYFERDILGAGPFDVLFYDEKVKAISYDGPQKAITIDYEGLGEMETNISIEDNERINRFLKRLANAVGKTLNELNPVLEASFQGFKFEGLMGIGGTNSRLKIWRLAHDL